MLECKELTIGTHTHTQEHEYTEIPKSPAEPSLQFQVAEYIEAVWVDISASIACLPEFYGPKK